MKTKYIQLMSVLLAGMIQVAPLLRSFLPNATGLAPSAWGVILKLGLGATALLGFDAVSQASSIAISPANATVGKPYVGTITYSGNHAGAVSSMMLSNVCVGGGIPFMDNLTIVYSGGYTAQVTGTPTNAQTTAFTLKVWSGACSGNHSDSRSTTLVVGGNGSGAVAPTIASLPNTVAQVGSDVLLSGVASGNPVPQYQWWTGGGIPIAGATNSIYEFPSVQLTNAGTYVLTASNSQNVGQGYLTLPKAACFLSVCITAGTNYSVYEYTNYAPAGLPLTMYAFLTNGTSTTTNSYQWIFNQSPTPVLSSSNTLPLPASFLTPLKSGTYTVTLNSTNSGGVIVSAQNYDSYWCFGYPPIFTNSLPAATNINAGSSLTLTLPIGGNLDTYYSANVGTGLVTNNGVANVFWYQNGNLVAAQSYVCDPTSTTTYSNSAVNASLALNNVSSANAGSYMVVVTNFWGSVTSSPIALSVASSSYAPVITSQPPSALGLLAGQSAAISVTVTGTPPISYVWQKNGASLANGGVYAGVLTNSLTLSNVTTANSGNYTVAITNSTGAITSSVADVSIVLPPSVSASVNGPGNLIIGGNTITDLTYIVQMSTNLATAVWLPIATNNSGSSGTVNFQTAPGSPNVFFRVRFP